MRELLDDQRGLVVVRGAQVKNAFVQGLAQSHGARERGDEGHLRARGQGQRGQARGRAHIGKQREHIFAQQLARVFRAALGLVAIVQRADHDAAPAYAPLRIQLVEIQPGAAVVLDSELRRRPGKGRGLPQHEAAFLRAHGRQAEQGSSGNGKLAAIGHGLSLRKNAKKTRHAAGRGSGPARQMSHHADRAPS